MMKGDHMDECTVCISYIFEIRETRQVLVAQDWLRHTSMAHRESIGTKRQAETIVELLEWADKVREALNG